MNGAIVTLLLAFVAAVATLGCAEESARQGDTQQLYLDLMKSSLTDLIYENDSRTRARLRGDFSFWQDVMRGGRYGYPRRAFTMIGLARLENIQTLVEDVLARGVPGDLIEAGA